MNNKYIFTLLLGVIALVVLLAACTNSGVAVNDLNGYSCVDTINDNGIDGSLVQAECSVCDTGYHWDGNACIANAYSCTNGEAASGRPATDGEVGCATCNTGYFMASDNSCQALCRVINDTQNAGLMRPTATFVLEATSNSDLALNFLMVQLPGGITLPTGVNDNGRAHIEDGYDIAETELSYAVWERVRSWAVDSDRGDNRYDFQPGRRGNDGTPCSSHDPHESSRSGEHPVTCVNWYDSVKFANALSEYCTAAGLEPVYMNGNTPLRSGNISPTIESNANGFRLATSEEWELAARFKSYNGDGNITESGEYYPGNYASGATAGYNNDTATKAVAWYYDNSNSRTHPVKQKNANALGLYDLSGNVWEWTFSANGANRLYRGGSWSSANSSQQVGYLWSGDLPTHTVENFGIRLVR